MHQAGAVDDCIRFKMFRLIGKLLGYYKMLYCTYSNTLSFCHFTYYSRHHSGLSAHVLCLVGGALPSREQSKCDLHLKTTNKDTSYVGALRRVSNAKFCNSSLI